MRTGVKFALEVVVLLALLGAGAAGVRFLYVRSHDSCAGLSSEQAVDCRYLDEALEDLVDASRRDLARVRCAGYVEKADRFLRFGARDKARKFVEQCVLLNGGRP